MWILLCLMLAIFTGSCLEPPPTPEQIGQAGWTILHTAALVYPDPPTIDQQQTMVAFITSFAKVYPCHMCSRHFQRLVMENPPKVTSKALLSQWICDAHNSVNRRLGKPEFNCTQVEQRWLPALSRGY